MFKSKITLYNRKLQRQKISETIKTSINLNISHLIFALHSGKVLSRMESRCYPVRLSSCKSLLSLVCITLKLCRSTGGSELCFSNAIYHGNFVLSVTKL